jgi:hypothetical protein
VLIRSAPWPLALGSLALALAAGPVACKKRAPVPDDLDAEASASLPSAAVSAALPPRCAEFERGALFTLGDTGSGAEEDDGGLPFAVELGSGAAYAHGFVVAGLKAKDGGTGALLALLGPDAGSGRVLELGQVHGGAAAPRVAAKGEVIVAVVPDGDASGQRLRLALVRDPENRPSVVWGAQIHEGRDDSSELDLAIGPEGRALVVWDEWDSKTERGTIQAASFSVADPSNATPARSIAPPSAQASERANKRPPALGAAKRKAAQANAETPRLAERPGGFWLGFVEVGATQAGGKRGSRDADPDEIEGSVMDLGSRRLFVAPLDANGSPIAVPVRVSPEHQHVLVYDVAALPDGSVLVAWRNDDTSPGVEGGAVHLARVASDGSVTRLPTDAADVGSGVPALVVSHGHGSEWRGWLTVAGVADATSLAALGRDGRLREKLEGDAYVKTAEPIAARGDVLLLARPRGLSMELGTARCALGAAPPAPSVPAPSVVRAGASAPGAGASAPGAGASASGVGASAPGVGRSPAAPATRK